MARTLALVLLLVALLAAIAAGSAVADKGQHAGSEAAALLQDAPKPAARASAASKNDERARFLGVVLPPGVHAQSTPAKPTKAPMLGQLRWNQNRDRDREELDYRYFWGNAGARVEGYDGPGYDGGAFGQVDLGE